MQHAHGQAVVAMMHADCSPLDLQFVLAKSFKYKSGDLAMFFEAFREDENVIQVDTLLPP